MKPPPLSTAAVGSRVRGLRLEQKLTQKKLAKKAGLSRLSVMNLEAGRYKNPKLSTLIRIARALGLDLTSLLDPSAAA